MLGRHLGELLPDGVRVLDVGCGDGLLAASIKAVRPDIEIVGIDVRRRPSTWIPVDEFDGRRIPYEDRSLDVVMCVDVFHHADNPMLLFRETVRTARRFVLVKDHLMEGPLAGATLRLMDVVGNARHGVALPHHYWRRQQWYDACESLELTIKALGIYPWPVTWAFDRSLHFIARFDVP